MLLRQSLSQNGIFFSKKISSSSSASPRALSFLRNTSVFLPRRQLHSAPSTSHSSIVLSRFDSQCTASSSHFTPRLTSAANLETDFPVKRGFSGLFGEKTGLNSSPSLLSARRTFASHSASISVRSSIKTLHSSPGISSYASDSLQSPLPEHEASHLVARAGSLLQLLGADRHFVTSKQAARRLFSTSRRANNASTGPSGNHDVDNVQRLMMTADQMPHDAMVQAQLSGALNASGRYLESMRRFESGRYALNDAVVRNYLAAVVASGGLGSFNLSQFVSLVSSRYGLSSGISAGATAARWQRSPSASSYPAEYDGMSDSSSTSSSAPGSPINVNIVSEPKSRQRNVSLAVSVLGWLVMVGFLVVLFRSMSKGGVGGKGTPFNMAPTHQKAEDVTTTFDDVKGVDEAKEELLELVDYLREPRKYARLGAKLPAGVLLSGPPGTGKTLLARAVAGEAGVPFFFTSGSGFDEIFVGVGSKRIRELFDEARKSAPCIVFIDEIDAIGGSREKRIMSHRESLNQLLTELDGFESADGVVIIGATNLPGSLDPALTRPGRFDKLVAVQKPDIKGRTEIIDLYLKKVVVGKDVHSGVLARGTPGFTGADLANLVNLAAVKAARRGLAAVTQKLLDEAKDDVLMGVVRKSAAARMPVAERRITAYHEGGHALVALFTPGSDPLHKATIIPRGQSLGVTMQLPELDRYSMTREQLLARIAVAMGGRAAEDLILGQDKVTTGASSDLQTATHLATEMVMRWGMGTGGTEVPGSQSGTRTPEKPSLRYQPNDAKPDAMALAEIERLLQEQYDRARRLLQENMPALHNLAQALQDHEELDGAQIKAISEGKRIPPPVIPQGEFSGNNDSGAVPST